MKHLGDITKINGAESPTVNVIIGGSPCQDLSVAGKRAGLGGERSGLFMEQIRIIKEMRKADAGRGRTGKDIRPRFMVWENVPGAFSSNKGADFGAVIQETIKIVNEKTPIVPMPDKGWSLAGCLYDAGGGWSVAWRVFDAQFWGVPQRRRRIALVADFGGLTAPEILFERKSVSGDYTKVGIPGERAAREVESSSDTTGARITARAFSFDSMASNSMKSKNPQSGCREVDKAKTLDATRPDPSKNQGGIAVVQKIPTYCIQGNSIGRADTAGCGGKGWTEDVSYTLNTVDRPAVYDARGNGGGKIAPTMTGDHNGHINDYTAILITKKEGLTVAEFKAKAEAEAGIASNIEQSPTLLAGNNEATVCIAIENHPNDSRVKFSANNTVQSPTGRMGTGGGNTPLVLNKIFALDRASFNQGAKHEVVRRLTPLECERLQGFPDGWTDIGEWKDGNGKKRKTCDSHRYKALGNSIAIPPWFYVLQKLSQYCNSDYTMASQFDGIGGFPLIWETLNGEGSCVWASEIEDFPIAVTSLRFPDTNKKEKLNEN